MSQYEHRKLMTKVNQQLCSEEFSTLMYIMCVPDEIVEATQSDRDRTRVLRYLEKQNIVGPQNYCCLVDALDTLGRRDLIMQITSEDPEGVVAKLPYIPQSIEPQQLAWLAKREIILGRKDKYVGCMRDLVVIIHSEPARENRFSNLCFRAAFPTLTSEQHQTPPQCHENAATTLIELSLFWKQWPTTFATFQQNGDYYKVKPLMSDCHSCFDRFNHELPPNWEVEIREHALHQRNKTQHPIGKFAREAHSAIHEISVELIGEKALEEASKRTKEALFVLESGHYIGKYLIPILKWLMTLAHSTSMLGTDASKLYATLKVIFSDHCEDLVRNRDILVGIIGEEVMHRISQELLHNMKDKVSDNKSDIDISIHAIIINSASVVWHVSLIMLAMKSLNFKLDHQAIQKRLVDFLVSQRKTMRQAYMHLSKRFTQGMQKEVDHYRELCEQKISHLVGGVSEKTIIQSLFNF